MAHPRPFYRVTAQGKLNGTEEFSFGFNIIAWPGNGQTLPAVTQQLADDIGLKVKTFFGKSLPTGVGITQNAILEYVKVNRIGVDGRYMDADSREYAVVPPVVGGSGTPVPVAPQNALVVSLIGTENPRALAGRGRFFLPPLRGMDAVGTTGLLTSDNATRIIDAVKVLIDDVNSLFGALGARYAGVGNTSSGSGSRAGREQLVSNIRVGNVVDTIRSRRRSLVETYLDRTIA